MAIVADGATIMAEGTADRIEMEKNAELIMGTNNSSIVSKRSVEKLYLPEPHFYRYFVRKPQRRSPTINRGYWLSMRAIDWVIRQFLEKPSDHPKIVVNLGCGYDPLPFQWRAKEKELCLNTKFIDVDYEELMISKRDIVINTSKLRGMLTNLKVPTSSDRSILLDSTEYSAIGCDLGNLPRLKRLIDSMIDHEQCLVLCIAEVSIAYMPTEAADSLISWTSTLSSDVTFCLLEQGSPDRPDHPFTKTMMNHFKKLKTPLHSVFEYPGNHTQAVRFQRAGYTHCETQNLWELWSDPHFLSPSQRLALDQIEPFDEWEEFALFASHYLLVVAHNRHEGSEANERRSRRDSIASIASDLSARTASPWNPEAGWFAMRYAEDKSDETKRHHGSAYMVPDQDAIATYGGIGPKARLASTVVCRPRKCEDTPPFIPHAEIGARCCHSVVTLTNGQNLLAGGRASPTEPKKDCWLQTGSVWARVHDLPEPRYRHRLCPVTLPDNRSGAVLFGGKTGPSRVADDVLLWDPLTGWQVLRSINQDPIPRFGASFVYLGFNHGLLFGGMRQDGIICQGLWRWRLVIRDNKVAGISFRSSNTMDVSVGAYPWFARLGASWALIRDELLIIGGVAKHGCIPRPFEMMSIIGSFSAFNEHEKEMPLRLCSLTPATSPDCPRPLLVGHSSHRTKNGTLILTGGGATCFSFGNYYNSGVWVLFEREAGLNIDWTVVKSQPAQSSAVQEVEDKPSTTVAQSDRVVDTIETLDAHEFSSLIHKSLPGVMKGLPLGPCTKIWNPTYLKNKISPGRSIVIHNSPVRNMNFQRKDFAYETLPFGNFIEKLSSPTSHIYLRALSNTNATTTPANFEEDWPELAPDVQIPPQLSPILSEAKHSSCLRISNNITMWLHYDVMANVLFQIHGVKKLVLFPPSDIKYLSFPPGSTTSELDVLPSERSKNSSNPNPNSDINIKTDPSDDDTRVLAPPGTTPYTVILNPGDALFIPPLWAHAGLSLPRHDLLPSATTNATTTNTSTNTPTNTNIHTNIALNIFFRSFPTQKYAAGRDVYGNRDLAAYEDGRRDLDRIVKRFLSVSAPTPSSKPTSTSTKENAAGDETTATTILDSIPMDVSRAYLERLADELKRKAAELR